jgi:mono/diheme cytochrome c family protein
MRSLPLKSLTSLTSLTNRSRFAAIAILAASLSAGCAAHHPAQAAAPAAGPAPQPPPAPASQTSLAAQGEALFKAYKCHECHGPHGEGTDDAPDLIGLRMNTAEIAAFLVKPSAHARSVGMPAVPADSPDLQPLAAFVLTLEHPK